MELFSNYRQQLSMLISIVNILYFLLAVILLTFSGNFILRLLKLSFNSYLESFLVSLTISLIILSLFSYFLLILNLQFLVGPFFWFFTALGFFNGIGRLIKKATPKFKIDRRLCLFTIILTVLMSLITVRSGWLTQDGLEFFGVNAHDGLWHLSLIGELKNHFPPQHPNFSGIELRGYHYFLDLLLAKFSLVFGFSEVDLYFRFFPFLTAVLWSLATFLLARKYFQDKVTSFLAVILSVLGGGFAYLLPLFHEGGVNFDSALGVSSPISSLINLQFAFSIPVLALDFYAFSQFLKEKTFAWGIIVVLFTGALFGFKIYAGMIAIFAIGLSSVFHLFKEREIKNIWVIFASGLLALGVYLPTSTHGAGLVFAPGEMIQSIIRGPLSWTLWELRRQVYAEHHNLFGLARMRILAFLVFTFGNLGTKSLGLGEILRFKKSEILTKNFGIFSFALLFSFLIPIFFIQSITPFNIIQFWWYFLYLMSFLTAILVWDFLKNKSKMVKLTFLLIFFVLTIPAAIYSFSGYLFAKTSYKIPFKQLSALRFLKENSSPDDIILEIPNIVQDDKLDFGLPVVPALAQRRLFVGLEIIEFSYLDKDRREKELRKIIAPLNCHTGKSKGGDPCRLKIISSYEAIQRNHISYIFSPQSLFWLEENSKISSLVYNHDRIFIYKITK